MNRFIFICARKHQIQGWISVSMSTNLKESGQTVQHFGLEMSDVNCFLEIPATYMHCTCYMTHIYLNYF